ncbi:Ig-like domain-containing protein [Ramlibacter albus]|uniref:Ig-like domain-containing protein n=1 Tax=Ramlibacter albus TaxID=2079448 RepID=A0A923MDW6_9BURK|nr:Ig-like domain-containing protein [Ramlibacter albus]MBC5768346.1 Ig-like domain-containing protein [Ramlibacter albus]
MRLWIGALVALVFSCALAPAKVAAQAQPTGYGYCAALYGQWPDQCWYGLFNPDPSTYIFATPHELCEKDLAGIRAGYPQYTWTDVYVPGPIWTGAGNAPWGVCQRTSNSVSGFGSGPLMIARVTWSPPKPAQPPEISLSGPSHTKALPAGPMLPQVATVTQAGSAVAGKAVFISISGSGPLSGTTNAAGQFQFTYTPPTQRATTATITATCTDCVAPATKQIVVDNCDVCIR